MNYLSEANIQCPFYVKREGKLLCCEGYIDGTCMTTRFKDKYTADQYLFDHCFHKTGGSCPMARNLFEKYRLIEEEENRKEREWYERLKRLGNMPSSVPSQRIHK